MREKLEELDSLPDVHAINMKINEYVEAIDKLRDEGVKIKWNTHIKH